LKRHEREQHSTSQKLWICEECGRSFQRKEAFNRHLRSQKNGKCPISAGRPKKM
jgi:rubrerythrin